MGAVYVVHHVDTEGPLKEDLEDLFNRLKTIFGIEVPASAANLQKLQRKEIPLGGLEEAVALVVDPHIVGFLETWEQIEEMLARVTSTTFRNQLKDSHGNGWVYNWHCMDHVGFKDNPRHRDLGFLKIFARYENLLLKSENKRDRIHWHFHPIHFRRAAHLSATSYVNSYAELIEIISRRLIEKNWFPLVNRAGFHTERPDSHAFLEQWIPFDASNQAVEEDSQPKEQLDLSLGRFGDWRGAPTDWSLYRPDNWDYSHEGKGKRAIARVLNMKSRHRSISAAEVEKAFASAARGKDSYLGVTNHDYRNMEPEINEVRQFLKLAKDKFPNVPFYFCEATEAFQKILYPKEDLTKKSLKLEIEILKGKKDQLIVKVMQGELFGPQPWLSLKTFDGEYFSDNFDVLKKGQVFSYVFDEYTLPLKEIQKIGVASNDRFGHQAIQVLTPI